MRRFIPIILLAFLAACSTEQQSVFTFDSFAKPETNPIVQADSSLTFVCPVINDTVQWQKADVFNPGAVVKDGKVHLLLRCEDNPAAILGGRTSRLGLAWSDDGIHFTKHPEPVLYPGNDHMKAFDYPGGCEDPRVVETEDGRYVVVYTSWNNDVARISVAVSNDLFKWEKTGLAFAKAHDGKFVDYWSKSGSIVTKMKGDRPVVAKINGKYWMYWGEQFVNLAWSENLTDWTPLLDENGELKRVASVRSGKFDSHLVECGPPALLTDEGIVLLYNGKNSTEDDSDPKLPKGMYSVGKLVFDAKDMEKVIFRSEEPFLKPSLPHEITGQYAAGTTFAEGLVYFKNKWFLYYGTADSFVGVAVSE